MYVQMLWQFPFGFKCLATFIADPVGMVVTSARLLMAMEACNIYEYLLPHLGQQWRFSNPCWDVWWPSSCHASANVFPQWSHINLQNMDRCLFNKWDIVYTGMYIDRFHRNFQPIKWLTIRHARIFNEHAAFVLMSW